MKRLEQRRIRALSYTRSQEAWCRLLESRNPIYSLMECQIVSEPIERTN